MAIYRFWWNPFCEDRSKRACWVSIIGPIFLQSEIEILCIKRNESHTERAYSQIEEASATLQIPPGSTVSELVLSEMTGIGPTPIREAIQRFAREHLIVIVSQRGLLVP